MAPSLSNDLQHIDTVSWETVSCGFMQVQKRLSVFRKSCGFFSDILLTALLHTILVFCHMPWMTKVSYVSSLWFVPSQILLVCQPFYLGFVSLIQWYHD